MAAGVIGYTILLLFRIILGTFQMGDCPNEYREVANIFMTKSIIDGQNIYSLDVLNGDNPGLIYLYGPLNSLIAAAISTIFPGSITEITKFSVVPASSPYSSVICSFKEETSNISSLIQ